MKSRQSAGLLLAAGFVLTACTPSIPAAVEQSQPSAVEPLTDPFAQTISWEPCEGPQVTTSPLPAPEDLENYQCATIAAPMNWNDLNSDPINLAIARYTGAGEDAPPLFFNLGGPGGDAVNSLSVFVEKMLPEEISEHYQIVAMDPRGVGESTPIRCRTDEELDQDLAGDDIDDPADLPIDERMALYRQEMADFAAQCEERNGDIVGFVDTFSAAQDFEMLRQLMGADSFDYVGYSYGTALGAVYADAFPDKVGRMVLDGALDPATDSNTLVALQARGMEESLYHWIEWCHQQSSCPLDPGLEPSKKQIKEFLTQLDEAPLKTNDPERPLTASLARTGIIGSLYSAESYPLLLQGMQMALNGNGTILLLLADYYNGREDDGSYSNSQDAFTVINALDMEPVGTVDEWVAQAEQLREELPVLGEDFGFSSAGLEGWPIQPQQRRTHVTAPGSAPIVVVGTTHDPATPYVMAESLAESLENAVLITVDDWNHGAYTQSGQECVQKAVSAYLLEGTVPAPLTCPGT